MRNLQRIPYKERFLVRALSAGLEDGFAAQAVILRDMRRHYPDDKEMLFGLGDAEFHSGSTDSAIVHFQAALAIDPVMERALQHLTWAYQRKGLDAEALASAKRWVDATHSIEAYEVLAACYTRAGNPTDALAALEVARERAPRNPIVPIRMAGILFMQRKIDEALEQADAAGDRAAVGAAPIAGCATSCTAALQSPHGQPDLLPTARRAARPHRRGSRSRRRFRHEPGHLSAGRGPQDPSVPRHRVPRWRHWPAGRGLRRTGRLGDRARDPPRRRGGRGPRAAGRGGHL